MAEYDIRSMTPEEREAAIERLELERLSTVSALEKKMQEFAALSGKRVLGKRKSKVGKAPNDYKGKKKL